MEKIKAFRVYNLVNSKGNKLQLELGLTNVRREDEPWCSTDKGYRWRFIGKHIPMPVRSLYWFNGFPEPIMLDWLKGNGWFVRTHVDLGSGYAEVFEINKGNAIDADALPLYERTFERIVCDLYHNGQKIDAIRLYRYVCGGTLRDAKNAVSEIVDQREETCYN